MKFILRFTNPYGERFWFCNLGNAWRANDTRRFIERTSPDAREAAQFDSTDKAKETLVQAGNPEGWDIVEVQV
jgi:hypothetical protein